MGIITATAPAHWAPYLINGDDSCMADAEILACRTWLGREGLGDPVSCIEYGFTWCHDAYREYPFGCECQEYAFID